MLIVYPLCVYRLYALNPDSFDQITSSKFTREGLSHSRAIAAMQS